MDISRPFDSLAGRTAVVTGAARGIGLAIAETLQAAGLTVLLVDRDAVELEVAVSQLTATGPAAGVAASLSTDDCLAPLEAVLATLPPLAIWVNNAGRTSHADASDVDLADLEEVFRDNTASALRGSQIAARAMSDGGSIVNITSFATVKALPLRLSYAASKAALENVTQYTAREWGPRGIRVNAVSPGYIDTRLTQWPEDDPRTAGKSATLATLPLPRIGTPTDIANTVLYLSSPLASYVTGQSILVDGGWHVV